MCAVSSDGARRLDMHILRKATLFTGLFVCLGVQAEIINYQEAIEASDITVSVRQSGNGFVEARSCHTCKSVRLEVTPATVITVNGKRISAAKKISRHWPGGVVIYNVETKQVVSLGL